MKRQFRWGLPGVLGTFPLLLTLAGPVSASDSPATARRAAADDVSQALQAEVEGKNSRRQGRLDAALEASPDLPAAHWHNGQVWADKHWVKFDDPSVIGNKPRLDAYLSKRGKYGNTVADQLALAKWCKTAGLKDEWRAHLGNVLSLDPDNKEARAALGYELVDGVWLTPQEIAKSKARAVAAVAALNKWKSKVVAIRTGMDSRSAGLRATAHKKLDAVQDAAAIPALELVFCGDSETMASVGVNHFADMRAADASLALARQALFSKWPEVRKAAIEKLKHRERETFIPELLSAMRSPIQSRIETFQEPDGRLLYRQALYRSGHDRDELVMLDNLYNPGVIASNIVPGAARADNRQALVEFDDGGKASILRDGTILPVGSQTPNERERAPMARAALGSNSFYRTKSGLAPVDPARAEAEAQAGAAARAAADAQASQAAIALSNAQTVAFNSAVCQLLKDTTGEANPQSPDAWSQWWVESDEVYVPEYKPLTSTYVGSQHDSYVAVPMQMEQMVHFSCLAAGTPIWTDKGLVAVDKIKVGDRVLAQDAETGELAYKPVMHTTVRFKADLVKLGFRDENITCSTGHRFWISGKGWLKASGIEPGMNFHGAEGTTPLQHNEPAGVGAVYNLIVADFHSYFVGKSMIYSHDITARKPTDRLVPGLAGSDRNLLVKR